MPTECERSDVTLFGQHPQQQPLQHTEIQNQQQQQQQQQQQEKAQQINQKNRVVQEEDKAQVVEKEGEEEVEADNQQKQYHETILVESEYYTMEERKELANTTTNTTTNGEMSTSQTSTTSTTSSNGHNGSSNGSGRKSSIISPDPTAYVTKARVTKPSPPPPSYNPMQFVQIKPSHLYQTAQQQLKKAEEVKKIKEVKKEEPEDWQNNLDNWKSSRRKRVEHIIDRVVEVKKLELEEHDRSRKKSKTFSEMIEERGERGARGRTKLVSLAVYNEDESNDLSDLGIGTSSASGKSSISEDYDNNSVMSDNAAELDKAIFESNNDSQQIENHQNNYLAKSTTENNNNNNNDNDTTREYVSSPGYDTSSSTAPASSPDPCEYTYEGAIQDYKQRVSRAASGNAIVYKLPINGNTSNTKNNFTSASKESTPERVNDTQAASTVYPTRRGSKIEDRLIGFEVTSPSDSQECVEKQKVDVPKIDISKRKEVFEQTTEPKLTTACTNGVAAPKVTLRDHFNVTATTKTSANTGENTNIKRDIKRMSGDMTSIRDRLQSLEQQQNHSAGKNGTPTVSRIDDIAVPPLKDRLSCLQNAVTKEEIKKKPVALVDDRQLEIMKDEDENAKLRLRQQYAEQASNDMISEIETEIGKTLQQLSTPPNHKDAEPVAGEEQLNAAIAALAIEEQQLEAAANAVNQIEAEFAELSDGALLAPPNNSATTNDMEFSVSVTNQNFPKEVICENISSRNNSYNGNNVNVIYGDLVKNFETQSNNLEVLGNADASTSAPTFVKLQRKPSNEMVHHRNLLKMFKDTFNNDIDLDEVEEEVQLPTPNEVTKSTEDAINNFELKENVSTSQTTSHIDPVQSSSCTSKASTSSVNIIPQSPATANRHTTSMIPRSLNGPVGKPPMSPIAARNYNKMTTPESPLGSPTAMRKPESQFSINGRVEIFNSKNINNNNNNHNNNNVGKPPTTPTLPRKSYLPHLISTTNTCNSSNGSEISTAESKSHIELPTSSVATTLTTVTQPLLSSFPMVSNNNININNCFDADVNVSNGRSMPTIEKTVNEPQVTRYSTSKPVLRTTTTTSLPYVQQEALKDRQQQQQQLLRERQSTENEVIICAPPITILNPDELPKPNTVRAMASCFSHSNDESFTGKPTPPKLPPKPMSRNQMTKLPRQIQKTPPQSPLSVKRDLATDIITPANFKEAAEKPTVSVRTSGMPTGYPFINRPKSNAASKENPLKPNEGLAPLELQAAPEPHLVSCAPNTSSLYKLSGSTPTSPISPRSTAMTSTQPSATDIALCSDFLDALGASADIKTFESPPKLEHQTTIEEVLCEKIDAKKLRPGESLPATGYAVITAEDVDRCDGVQVSENKVHAKVDAKAQSPIGVARAEHSKALIETCERIIAEERLASSRLKSAMTPIKKPVETASPTMPRKSKIPLPRSIPCLKGSDSMNNADLEAKKSNHNVEEDEGPVIARLHVVETQIKVTSTPPTSPKVVPKSQLPSPVAQPKKTRNIFEFLKKNFGHNEVAPSTDKTQENQHPTPSPRNKDKVEKTKDKIVVSEDEIHTVDNSKFYLPIDDDNNNNNNKNKIDDNKINNIDGGEEAPPPLPLTPAPVNIEITKTITTDEILEAANTELALSREINNMLDKELEMFKTEKAFVKD